MMCVKTPATEAATREIAPHLAPGTLVLSLQNGVENAAKIRSECNNPVAAAVIALEMLAFCWVNVRSGTGQISELIYWLVVAGVCAVIVAGRLPIAPIRPAGSAL